MAVTFRNLTTSPDDPVTVWPTEAVRAALERGDIADWQRLAAEVERDPWGRTARRIEEVLTGTRPFGISEAIDEMIDRARRRREREERDAVAAETRDLVRRSGLTKAGFASRIGTSPSRLSTYLSGQVTPSAALMVRIRSVRL
ncbi:MAG: helix-turn-helix transcriptional regulator [Actinomycetota bacterium]